ncbi:MAG: Uncharacterised protein [Rhodospirillaceae bacterium]|nr:MAG: Uncharacterised protein [Rhodospirillaceae bacterium]
MVSNKRQRYLARAIDFNWYKYRQVTWRNQLTTEQDLGFFIHFFRGDLEG